jgi:hypothetical protein
MLSSHINCPHHLVHFPTNSYHRQHKKKKSGSLSRIHVHGENIVDGFSTHDPLPSFHQPAVRRYTPFPKFSILHSNISGRNYIRTVLFLDTILNTMCQFLYILGDFLRCICSIGKYWVVLRSISILIFPPSKKIN